MTRSFLGAVSAVLVFGLIAAAAPAIQVDSETYDFGTIIEGIAIEHTFVITNVGDETLIIDKVDPKCGCTAAVLATNELAPGESVELHAVVSTTGDGGRTVTKSIWVYSNDPQYDKSAGPDFLSLLITGDVLRPEAYNTTTGDVYYYTLPLIDLRSESEYEAGHLLGAVNIPLDRLSEYAMRLPENNVLILYDATGGTAEDATLNLIAAGFPLARVLSGGLAAWTRAYGTQYLFPAPSSTDYGAPEVAAAGYSLDASTLHRTFHVLVDVRSAEAFAAGHLIGAMNIPYDEFDVADLDRWLGDLPKDVAITVYDQTGAQSDEAARALIAAGYTKARSLLGGLVEWSRIYGNELIWTDKP